ncbi:MAG TPA: acetoacetate decarboxylase family protein [Smithella sp.]|nr:acetoacetate decarboxylase family protein [Smithella sp.]
MNQENQSDSSYLIDPDNNAIRVPAVPAPWNLEGRGYIVLYKFKKKFLQTRAYLPKEEKMEPAGGLGALMIVDYKSSNAGPYSELLFIPGKLHINGGRWHRITRIYVSTMDSVLNGRKNWAIPKDLADFKFSQNGNMEEVEISTGGRTFFRASLKVWGPRFPASTKLLPFPLMQGEKGSYLNTNFSGSGWGRFATLMKIEADQVFFPDLSLAKPLAAMFVDPFKIVFPRAIPGR